MTSRVAIIVGAGPGVSGSFARALAGEGYDVGLYGSDADQVAELAGSVASLGVRVESAVGDITAVDQARAEIAELANRFGRVDLVHFNPSAFRQKSPLELSVSELLDDVALGVGGLLTAVQALHPLMSAGGRVTVTGSMAADKPWNEAASLGVQKAGVRNLVHSLDATLAPEGIRAVSVTVRGALSRDGKFTPDKVAAALMAAMRQDEAGWQSEVPFTGQAVDA